LNYTLNKKVEFIDLGLIDYKEAWDYQESLFQRIIDVKLKNRDLGPEKQVQTPNYLLFCEHPHVYTLGKSGTDSHLLLNEKGLKKRKASFYRINRGGDITYHGPGQIVGYPILDLDNFFTDIHQYLRTLEEAVIRTLAEYGVKVGRIKGLTGVWIDFEDQEKARKICALGVKASRWVTMHGFAFNVDPDLSYFNHIVPCGIYDKGVTSLTKELKDEIDQDFIREKLRNHIADLFEMDLVEHEEEYPIS